VEHQLGWPAIHMKNLHAKRAKIFSLLAAMVAAYFLFEELKFRAMHKMPEGLVRFNISATVPACGRWKDHMSAQRDPEIYQVYIAARKLWRSKIEWQLTHAEAARILNDVSFAAGKGDWGAKALMATFYGEGLGPLESNHVLDPDADKAVAIIRQAVAAGLPWGFYDLGVAYEYGYGGAYQDHAIAWAYYLKAAQLGSPEAQMALADAYGRNDMLDKENTMLQCAFAQEHGPAATLLGMTARVQNRYRDAINLYQQGVKFGCKDCASALYLMFGEGHWSQPNDSELQEMKMLKITADPERASRYLAIDEALAINPDLKLTRLDSVLPLPPAKLPPWKGVEDAVAPEPIGPPTY
jgi:TPR repeat protein